MSPLAQTLLDRLRGGTRQAAISLLAALAAYLPTHFIGLHQGFWSAITAITVSQSQLRETQTVGRKQFYGVAIGGLATLGMVLWLGTTLPAYAAAVGLAVIAAWLLGASEAAQVAGITATIIILVPHTGSPPALVFLSRLGEVGWGICAGLAVVAVETRLPFLRPPGPGA